MMRSILAALAAALALLSGCASEGSMDPEFRAIDPGNLPPANIT